MIYLNAFFRRNIFFVISFFFAVFSISYTPPVIAATNLITNPSAEIGKPNDWSKNSWGSNSPVYTMEVDGQDGSKSLKIAMNSYTDGDARWSFKDVVVLPNTQYTFSAFYKSNVPVEVNMDSATSANSHIYSWLGDLPASPNSWTQATYNFTTEANVRSLNIYIPIFSVGWVQVDNFSLTTNSIAPVLTPLPTPDLTPLPAPTPLPNPAPIPVVSSQNGFNRPLISIDFDDGWKNSFNSGFPVLNQFGFKGSAMVVTDATQNPARYKNLYMNANDLVILKDQGHKIGSHSATHANLVGLNDGQLQSEIANSKFYLEGLLGQPVNYFVTPFCRYDRTVTSFVQQYYTVGQRNCDSNVNTKENFNQFNVRAFPILSFTSLYELQSAINTAKQENQWLVLMYHEVKPGGATYSVTQETLVSHMQAISDSGITVLPSEDAIAEITSQ